ncbi:MAG TPA: SDR family NAD(P)-dependent oxidoreductase, partial [Myxococcota bacterium]|nr:SDR family NAD(P)-dependent oxidoreductase [Myxococcota bacterium]
SGWRADPGDRYALACDDKDELARLLDAIGRETLRGIVHCWSLDAPAPDETTTESLEASLLSAGLSVVHLAQLLDAPGIGAAPRLWLVSRRAQSVAPGGDDLPESTAPARASLWGVGRVVAAEVPKLRATLVDLDRGDEQEIAALAEELLGDGEEDEIALRASARYVHRYERSSEIAQRATHASGPALEAFRLEPSPTGMLDRMGWRARRREPPGAGRVEIEVAVAGLNFADVMKALGLYPGLADGPIPLGIECSGRIASLGAGVAQQHGFAVGDEVVAIAPFAFGSHVETDARLVSRKPARLGFEEAATLPIAFLTSWYALYQLGRLQAGERVLIHSATGGVGLAALQLARRVGAQAFATAGTPEKRDFLRALGVEHVFDSRSLAFADELMRATSGEGVDVVLNSLAGDAIGKGLSVLRDHGRFLEIGKRDIYADTRLGLRPFRRNLSFVAIDLDRAMRERLDLLASLFRDVIAEVDAGRLAPLPFRVFPAFNHAGAFRTMSQARHFGKVLVSLRAARGRIAPPLPEPASFRADATYLITGGLGGFGCIVARWMVEHGARHLALVGRSGATSDEAARALEELRAAGAQVRVLRADVSERAAVDRVLAEIDAEMPPLRGVIHAAMVLKDRLIADLNHERMREVWAPKVHGAWNLHAATLGRELDCFVLFSSLSSVFGIGGQANYASGNAFLDALSYQRQAAGLPSVTISWGYLADVGWVARHDEIGQRLKALGVKSFTPRQALQLLGRFLVEQPPHVGVMGIDWRVWSEATSASRVSPRFAALVRASAAGGPDERGRRGGAAIKGEILSAPPEERMPMLVDLVRSQVARVLGAAPAKLDVEKSLTQLGLDSLMAVELRNWIEGELRLTLPTVELMRGPSVVRLAELLLEQIESPGAGASAARRPDAAAETHRQDVVSPRGSQPSASEPSDPAAAERGSIRADGGDGGRGSSGVDRALNASDSARVGSSEQQRAEASALLGRLDELSDGEVDALLERMSGAE